MSDKTSIAPTRGPWRLITDKAAMPSTLYSGIIALLQDTGEPDGYAAVILTNGDRADEWCAEADVSAKHVANARLISAAPDLLAALQAALEAPEQTDWIDGARRAVERALGATP